MIIAQWIKSMHRGHQKCSLSWQAATKNSKPIPSSTNRANSRPTAKTRQIKIYNPLWKHSRIPKSHSRQRRTPSLTISASVRKVHWNREAKYPLRCSPTTLASTFPTNWANNRPSVYCSTDLRYWLIAHATAYAQSSCRAQQDSDMC